jgi:pyruvate/2-oxoglutarate/acetoin dehydrogenase E1 component
MKKKLFKFSEIINFTLRDILKKNKKVICYGLGINDPKGIFGTTKNLRKIFGNKRIFDVPISENSLTGIALGMSLSGYIPIVTHQRLDFFILAMDQLVNNLAKWKFMFSSNKKTTVIIRLIVGRGWGQGPTHSQSLHSWFAHIPGIKVLTPCFAEDYRKLLIQSLKEEGPIIIIEHRWLHDIKSFYNKNFNSIKFGKSKLLNKGSKLTIVTFSYSTIEIMQLKNLLKANKISYDHIDLLSIKPLDYNSIYLSCKKTGRLLILDNLSHNKCSIGKDIISHIIEKNHRIFITPPVLLTLPEYPSPTSHYLNKFFYVNHIQIIQKIENILNTKIKIDLNFRDQVLSKSHDIPNKDFSGPF